jgi:LysR family transcriptional regulator, low CO2-responsive transcriptional regulator
MTRIGSAYRKDAKQSRERHGFAIFARLMAANYQHLRAFHAIAVDGGVSRAARRLHVSQPTLSQQLKALEARHGVALFESRKAPLTLTAAGRELFALTQKLFAVASDIDDVLGEKAAVAGGMFRLGSDNPFYAAKITEMLRRRHPFTEVQVRMGNARDVMRWLGDAQIDAALASDPRGEGGFNYEPLSSDTLACAVPADHELSRLDAIPMHAFADETLLLREPNSKTRAFTERALADASVVPRATIELQSREAIREGIALRLGVSAFFSSECPPDIRIAYRPLDTGDRDYRLRNYLVYQSDRKRSPLMRAIRAIVDEIKVA